MSAAAMERACINHKAGEAKRERKNKGWLWRQLCPIIAVGGGLGGVVGTEVYHRD